ncbi:MAG: hypothetical protein U0Y68_07830 [Blastocatellia bacterium]
MKQKLTSRFPLFVRALALVVLGLPFWIVVYSFVPHAMLREWRWAVVGFALYQLLFLGILILRLKDVWIDENYLYLATFFRKAQAPLEAIASITENNRGRITQIKMLFTRPTDIGTKLSFIPYFSFFQNHPAMNEINRLVMNKKAARGLR